MFDCIVLTQSCDLVNAPQPKLVTLCPVHSIAAFEEANPSFAKGKGPWSEVRSGRREGLHLLSATKPSIDFRECRVVDFREVYSLPFDYLSEKALKLERRWRLESPFLEHFSQAFARFFMRVGLPSNLPKPE